MRFISELSNLSIHNVTKYEHLQADGIELRFSGITSSDVNK